MEAALLHEEIFQLAEGPFWCAEQNSLVWVDIEGKSFHQYHWERKQLKSFPMPSRPGFVVQGQDGQFIMGLEGGLASFDVDTEELGYFLEVEKGQAHQRFNDGKCDPQGRLWFGTMNIDAKPAAGAFYLLDQDLHLHKKSEGFTIPNGLAWSLDHERLYHIDSPERCIQSYFFDGLSGEIRFEKTAIQIPEELGMPDGMTIDEEGMLWVAHWGGFGVYRWNPANGQLLTKIALPVPQVTSCAFGGKDLDHLFITTASKFLSEEEQQKHPLSGGIFVVKPGISGFLPNKFAGH